MKLFPSITALNDIMLNKTYFLVIIETVTYFFRILLFFLVLDLLTHLSFHYNSSYGFRGRQSGNSLSNLTPSFRQQYLRSLLSINCGELANLCFETIFSFCPIWCIYSIVPKTFVSFLAILLCVLMYLLVLNGLATDFFPQL